MVVATGSTAPAGTAFNTIDLKVNYLRPVLPGESELRAKATVVHRGRTIALVSCDILDADKLVAQATSSFLILPGRFWERPVEVAEEMPQDTGLVLTTLLLIDVVDSTRQVEELGDQRWRDVLTEYQTAVREELQRFNGTEIDSVGDGFLAAFDSAARAVRCAASILRAVRRAGVETRAAVHTGECERSDGKLVGLAVHVAARIESLAGPGEILVSSIVRDLVGGSRIAFEPRGEHELKGIAGSWPLFAAKL
jgi:class 3 adenylate cyclase